MAYVLSSRYLNRFCYRSAACIVLFMLLLLHESWAQVKVLVSPVEAVVNVGAEFTIEVKVESGTQQVDGANVFLAFDPALVQVVSATAGTALGVPLSPISFDNSTGIISYAYGAFSNFPSGTFTLFSAKMRASENGSSSLRFVSRNGIATDLSFRSASVLEQKLDGQVKAGGVTALAGDAGSTGSEILFYPNPTTGTIQLSFGGQVAQQVHISIYRTDGTLVKSILENVNIGKIIALDFSAEAAGIYLLEVQTPQVKKVQWLLKQ